MSAPVTAESGLFFGTDPISKWTVSTAKPVTYDVATSDGVLHPANPDLIGSHHERGCRRLVVTDSVVYELFGEAIEAYFAANTTDHRILVVSDGETEKTFDAVFDIVHAMDDFGLDRRREPVIAIGGGVLLDLVGLASSLYRRAIPFVRVPTTLIGLVDAGVGAKTGVNFNGHKNRLGTYFPASRTLLDRSFLTTLPERHVSNGLAEILKIALVKDAPLFALLEDSAEHLVHSRMESLSGGGQVSRQVIEHAITGMLEELQPNLWEETLERVVDYGHTFSPTIEMLALPDLLHGEAVAVDMALTTVLAQQRGEISVLDRDRVLQLTRRLGLPTWHPTCAPDVLVTALSETVRHRDGQQRLPLPLGIGQAHFVNDVLSDELVSASKALRDLTATAEAQPVAS